MLVWVNLAASQEPPKRPAPPRLPPGVRVPAGSSIRRRRPRAEPPRPLPAREGRGSAAAGRVDSWRGLDGRQQGRLPRPVAGRKGYAAASINYRLSQHAVFPAQIEDCKAAIRWLRANAAKYRLDPDHIGVWGASAGGHLVAMLGVTAAAKELEGKGGNLDQASRVQCVVDWFGPSDMLTMSGSHDNPASPESRLIGGPVQENQEKARKASPLTYVSKDAAPFLIMHGDQDKLVPVQQSKVLAEALQKAGVEVRLVIVKGNGHGGPGFNSPENRKLIEDFFAKHLGKGT